MEILGYLLAILIGVSLGLIGGGGSILTVPVLVYVMGVSPVLSTAYSLFVVGLTALVGSLSYARQRLLDYRTAAIFGAPAIATVYATRKFLMPVIPDPLLRVGDFVVTKDAGVLLLFAVLMIAASVSMIRGSNGSDDAQSAENQPTKPPRRYNYPLIFAEGVVVGVLTGLVGAGGGFLIIPALVLFAGLEMKEAVGTSLLIIGVKSLIGFLGDLGHQPIEWGFLLLFSSFAVGGIFVGSRLARYVSGAKLKPAFGWFVLAMGVYILVKELLPPTL